MTRPRTLRKLSRISMRPSTWLFRAEIWNSFSARAGEASARRLNTSRRDAENLTRSDCDGPVFPRAAEQALVLSTESPQRAGRAPAFFPLLWMHSTRICPVCRKITSRAGSPC